MGLQIVGKYFNILVLFFVIKLVYYVQVRQINIGLYSVTLGYVILILEYFLRAKI